MESLNNIDLVSLYVSYKLGVAAGFLMLFFILMMIISSLTLTKVAYKGDNDTAKLFYRSFLLELLLFMFCGVIWITSPSLDELKAVAVYKVSHEAVTSEVSQKLIDALIHFLNK